MEEHISSECPGREYQCQDCGLKDKYRVITGPHEDECKKKMVSCVNKECDSLLERGCVQEHVQLSCNYTEVSCEYASLGCGEKRIRLEMKAHEKDHVSLATNKITELSNQGLQVTFMVPQYNHKRRKNRRHDSEHFFTSRYKMCLLVYANGDGGGKRTHLSVYLFILHGPHDDQLDWPLNGTFVIELLNQLEDNNHYSETLDYRCDEERCRPGGIGLGFPTFIEQSELDFNWSRNTQYLKDNKLYIRVTPKIESSCKPWLDYTHE